MRKKPQPKKTYSHVTPAGRNIFLDLGFPAREAQRLLWESDKKIVRAQQEKQAKEMKVVVTKKK